jgi:hypothetical protein
MATIIIKEIFLLALLDIILHPAKDFYSKESFLRVDETLNLLRVKNLGFIIMSTLLICFMLKC